MTDLAQAPVLTPMPASVWVACGLDLCPAFGVQRRIWLAQVAPGVVAVPQLFCAACGMSLQLPLFPDVEEAYVPKIHVGREPTDRADIPAAAPAPEPVELEADAAPAEAEETAEVPAAAKTRKTGPRKKAS